MVTFLLMGAAGLTGCGGGGGSSSPSARATFVLANDAAIAGGGVVGVRDSSGGQGHVPVEDILSLTVSISEITLQRCGGEDTEHGADEEENVYVNDFSFDPTCLTIEEGGTVIWNWETDTEHTITSGSPGDDDAGVLFDEVGSGTGTAVKLIFEEAGIYPYFSDTDADVAAGMAGTIKVVADDDEDEEGDDDHHGGGDGENEHDRRSGDHGEGHDEGGALITVFEGSFDVNLLDLTLLSEVLTSAEIPAGRYCRIILEISDPRLVLASDPDTVITDVHLTANGRLFIKDRFEIGEGEDIIIVLNFGGVHLVQRGDGGYVLTPKVRADVNVDEQETAIAGEVVSVNPETHIVEVEGADLTIYEVLVTEDTVIKTDNDSNDSSEFRQGDDDYLYLKLEDLQPGMHVEVEGTLSEGGQILADVIVVADEDFDSPTEVEIEGEIISIDPETGIIEVQTGDGVVEVQVTDDTQIKSDDDSDDARTESEYVHLKFEDLVVGMHVEVEGLQSDGGIIRAREIEVADDDFGSPVVVEFSGEILSVDAEGSSVEVSTEGGTYTLIVNDDTTIKTDNDSDDTVRTGDSEYLYLKFDDLAVGQHVDVRAYETGELEARADRIVVADEDYETPAEI